MNTINPMKSRKASFMKGVIHLWIWCLCLVMFFAACQNGARSAVVKDDSLITQQPCSPPCWQGLVPGTTSYKEAMTFLASSPLIQGNVGQQNSVEDAGSYQHWWWTGESQDVDCQNTFDFDQSGVLDQIYIHPNTNITIEDVIKKYGPPSQIFFTGQILLPANPFMKGREGIQMGALFEEENLLVFWFEEWKLSFPMRFCPSLITNIEEVRFGRSDKIQSSPSAWRRTNSPIVIGPGVSYVYIKDGQVAMDCIEFK